MKNWMLWSSLLMGVAGCGQQEAPQPIVAGKLESGVFYKYPLTAASNEGSSFDKNSRAEVYDHFVVVSTPGGTQCVYPHGFYNNLSIKKDR